MIKIRQEQPTDYAAVFQVNQLAFGQDNESRLVELLRKSDAWIPELSMVAERQEEIVGYILFTKIQIIGTSQSYDSPRLYCALAPVAVSPNYQKQGIGAQLINEGLAQAKNLGYDSVIVLGHKDYYPRFGFETASRWGIRCPFEVPDEVFMGLELTKGSLENKSGTVKYDQAFGEV